MTVSIHITHSQDIVSPPPPPPLSLSLSLSHTHTHTHTHTYTYNYNSNITLKKTCIFNMNAIYLHIILYTVLCMEINLFH